MSIQELAVPGQRISGNAELGSVGDVLAILVEREQGPRQKLGCLCSLRFHCAAVRVGRPQHGQSEVPEAVAGRNLEFLKVNAHVVSQAPAAEFKLELL